MLLNKMHNIKRGNTHNKIKKKNSKEGMNTLEKSSTLNERNLQ